MISYHRFVPDCFAFAAKPKELNWLTSHNAHGTLREWQCLIVGPKKIPKQHGASLQPSDSSNSMQLMAPYPSIIRATVVSEDLKIPREVATPALAHRNKDALAQAKFASRVWKLKTPKGK